MFGVKVEIHHFHLEVILIIGQQASYILFTMQTPSTWSIKFTYLFLMLWMAYACDLLLQPGRHTIYEQ